MSPIEGPEAEIKLDEKTSVASLEWDKVRFRVPIIADDTMHVRVIFDSKRASGSDPNGIVIEKVGMINQKGEVMIDAEHVTLSFNRADKADG